MAIPKSGSDRAGVSSPLTAGLCDRGVDPGVRLGGVPFRSRSALAFGRSVRVFAYDARLSCNA